MILRAMFRFATALLGACLAAALAHATGPVLRIAKFSGDRAGALTYTFDDNLRDQYTVGVPMLNEFGLKGTFFVIPGKTSDTVEDAERRQHDKRAWGTITWTELKEMAAQGHEIASHTWTHPGLAKLTPEEVEAQFVQANEAIRAKLGLAPLTLAFPFNQSTPGIQAVALKHYVAFRSYQHGIGGRSTVESLNAWAEKQIRDRSWGVAMLHGVATGYAALADPEILREHLRYVKSRGQDLWVDTFANVARYEKEREDAKLLASSSAPGRLVCVLAGSLDPARFDVPLTLVVETRGAQSVLAERAGRRLPARVAATTLLVDAAPSAEPITIAWD